MKILALIISLWLVVATTAAFSDEGKTIDIKEMLKVSQMLNKNSSFLYDPEAMATMKRLVVTLEENPQIKNIMKNPEGLAAMLRILNKYEDAHALKVE